MLAHAASRLSDIPMAITSAAAASVRRGRVQSHATIAPHQSPRGPSRSAGSIRPRFPHTFAAMSRAASPPCGGGGGGGGGGVGRDPNPPPPPARPPPQEASRPPRGGPDRPPLVDPPRRDRQ